jgi:subtilisin family serine protease
VGGRNRILLIVCLLVCLGVPASAAAAPSAGRYIVVLKQGAADPGEHAREYGALPTHLYRRVLNGYSARIPDSQVALLRADKRVAYVERDQRVSAVTTQTGATWGIDRIDQRNLPLSGTFTYTRTGAGVKAYIIDSGIQFNHTEFGGRAVSGYDAIDGGSADDCDGHGTHVAGTVGGARYGVAKSVRLVAVRVLDCTGFGFTSEVIAGIDWVTGNHPAGAPAVANMSLGGAASTSLDQAVKRSIADGVSYSVAAGNGDSFGNAVNACTQSPARVPEAMTISASDRNDRKASWANYGSCVDWFAPGVGITSAWWSPLSRSSTNTISGTSMSAPHTAGVAALYLQTSPGASPATVRTFLYNASTANKVSGSNTANNRLLFTHFL